MKPKGAAEIVQATRLKLAQPRYSFATFHPGSPSPLPPSPAPPPTIHRNAPPSLPARRRAHDLKDRSEMD